MNQEMVRVYGSAGCEACLFTEKAFALARIPYHVVDVDRDPAGARAAQQIAGELEERRLPIVVCPDGSRWAGLQLDRIAAHVRARSSATSTVSE